jgi:hypothetical protein
VNAAVAIAVLKYRLYEIDIVSSKAVLYGSLAVFITAVYAALVVGVGTLAGNQRSPLLAALAAVVAVAIQPVRQWAGRLANRLVCGRRAIPQQVLSDFARCIGGTYANPKAQRRWPTSWRPEPAPSRLWPGCGSMTSSAPRPPPAAARLQLRCRSLATRCCRRRPAPT